MPPNLGSAFANDAHQTFALEGNRGAALLIHGFPGTPAEVRPLADALHAKGWAVHAPLLPGFGREIDSLSDYSHQDWLAAAETILLELTAHHEKVIIGGYSMGGALAMCLAARHTVDGVVLLAPFTQLQHVLWHALPLIGLILPTVKIFRLFKPDFTDSQTRDSILTFMPELDLDDPQVRQMLLDFELPVTIFNEIRRLGKSAWHAAQSIQAPVLIIQGSQDELVKPNMTQRLMQRFKGHVRYTAVDNGHELMASDAATWPYVQAEICAFAEATSIGGHEHAQEE